MISKNVEMKAAINGLWHEYSKIFPMLEGEQRLDLQRDIRDNGVREPIVQFNGQILDGRNRYICARESGIEVPVVQFEGSEQEAFDYVISRNLHRRHLTQNQRKSIAGKAATMPRGGDRKSDQTARLRFDSTAATAAKMNVSQRGTEQAKSVHQKGVPELVQAMWDGTASVSAAAEVAKLPKDEQAEIVEAGPGAIKAKAAELRNAPKEETAEEAVEADADDSPLEKADSPVDNPADNPATDIEKTAPQTNVSQPEDANSQPDTQDADTEPPTDNSRTEEPVSEAEVKLRKELRKLTPEAIEDDWIGLQIENTERKAEIRKLNRKIEDQEDQISYLAADDQAQEVIKAREEVRRIEKRASDWMEKHGEERKLANRLRHVIKKLEKEVKELKARLGDYGGANDAA